MQEHDPRELLEKLASEIVTREELEELVHAVGRRKPRAYIGFEPSGNVHIGHLPLLSALRALQQLGFQIILLLADLHAFLNEKGTFEHIREIAAYNQRCFAASGLGEETKFILGSSFQLEESYMLEVLRLATITTENRARRSMDELSRSKEDRKVSQAIYPLMQTIDIAHLDIDVAVGGIDQRKIHMLAREHLPKLGFRAPVCVHTPLLIGLDGEKMSSSRGNFIAVDEPAESVERKLMAAFCPPEIADGNPIAQIYRHTIFPNVPGGRVTIERSARYGGNVEYASYQAFELEYLKGALHPSDVKLNAVRYLNEILEPIRQKAR